MCALARLTVTCGEGYVLSLDSDAAVSVLQSGGEFSVKLATNIPQEELTCTLSDGGDSWIGTPRVHGCVRRPAPDLHGFGEQRLLGT